MGGNSIGYSDSKGLARTTIDAAIEKAIAAADVAELETLANIATPEQAALIKAGIAKCAKKAIENKVENLTNQQLKDLYGKDGVELFRVLFKNPSKNPGLTSDQLSAYKELALRAIEKYKQSNNLLGLETQTNRIDIINKFLP